MTYAEPGDGRETSADFFIHVRLEDDVRMEARFLEAEVGRLSI